jgi:hypothetical protein
VWYPRTSDAAVAGIAAAAEAALNKAKNASAPPPRLSRPQRQCAVHLALLF